MRRPEVARGGSQVPVGRPAAAPAQGSVALRVVVHEGHVEPGTGRRLEEGSEEFSRLSYRVSP